MQNEAREPDCKTCARRKSCFVKEFKVLSCEDYKSEEEQKEQIDKQK